MEASNKVSDFAGKLGGRQRRGDAAPRTSAGANVRGNSLSPEPAEAMVVAW
jgi:hypothetical protein